MNTDILHTNTHNYLESGCVWNCMGAVGLVRRADGGHSSGEEAIPQSEGAGLGSTKPFAEWKLLKQGETGVGGPSFSVG